MFGNYQELSGSDLEIEILCSDHEKTALQRQIDATDRQVDQLVYELYGLTEEEVKIVEGSVVQK